MNHWSSALALPVGLCPIFSPIAWCPTYQPVIWMTDCLSHAALQESTHNARAAHGSQAEMLERRGLSALPTTWCEA
eukprot:2411880-Karenia_brevis.AAC.1